MNEGLSFLLDGLNGFAMHRGIPMSIPIAEYMDSVYRQLPHNENYSSFHHGLLSINKDNCCISADPDYYMRKFWIYRLGSSLALPLPPNTVFLKFMRNCFDHYLHNTEGGSSQRYWNWASRQIDFGLNGSKISAQQFENVFAVFLGFTREIDAHFGDHKSVSGITLFVSKDDETLLTRIKDYQFDIYDGRRRKSKQTQNEIQLIYLYNIILYLRLMQAEGLFDQEDRK